MSEKVEVKNFGVVEMSDFFDSKLEVSMVRRKTSDAPDDFDLKITALPNSDSGFVSELSVIYVHPKGLRDLAKLLLDAADDMEG